MLRRAITCTPAPAKHFIWHHARPDKHHNSLWPLTPASTLNLYQLLPALHPSAENVGYDAESGCLQYPVIEASKDFCSYRHFRLIRHIIW